MVGRVEGVREASVGAFAYAVFGNMLKESSLYFFNISRSYFVLEYIHLHKLLSILF